MRINSCHECHGIGIQTVLCRVHQKGAYIDKEFGDNAFNNYS